MAEDPESAKREMLFHVGPEPGADLTDAEQRRAFAKQIVEAINDGLAKRRVEGGGG